MADKIIIMIRRTILQIMILITISTVIGDSLRMVLFSLLISRAIARHALAPLETMLLKVRPDEGSRLPRDSWAPFLKGSIGVPLRDL